MLAAEREAFERDGAVVLRGMFKDWMETLREGVEYNATHPGPDYRVPGAGPEKIIPFPWPKTLAMEITIALLCIDLTPCTQATPESI